MNLERSLQETLRRVEDPAPLIEYLNLCRRLDRPSEAAAFGGRKWEGNVGEVPGDLLPRRIPIRIVGEVLARNSLHVPIVFSVRDQHIRVPPDNQAIRISSSSTFLDLDVIQIFHCWFHELWTWSRGKPGYVSTYKNRHPLTPSYALHCASIRYLYDLPLDHKLDEKAIADLKDFRNIWGSILSHPWAREVTYFLLSESPFFPHVCRWGVELGHLRETGLDGGESTP